MQAGRPAGAPCGRGKARVRLQGALFLWSHLLPQHIPPTLGLVSEDVARIY